MDEKPDSDAVETPKPDPATLPLDTGNPEHVENLRIKLRPSTMAVLLPFMAERDIRFYLNGIYVERLAGRDEPGVVAVATNGAAMAVVIDADGMIAGAQSAIIRPDRLTQAVCRRLVKADRAGHSKGTDHLQRVLVKGRRLSVAVDFSSEFGTLEKHVQAGNCLVAGKYPDWRRVMPVWDRLMPDRTAMLSASLLAKLPAVAALLGDKEKFNGIQAWRQHLMSDPKRHDPASAVVLQLHALPNFMAVVMPMSANGTELDDMRNCLRPMCRQVKP